MCKQAISDLIADPERHFALVRKLPRSFNVELELDPSPSEAITDRLHHGGRTALWRSGRSKRLSQTRRAGERIAQASASAPRAPSSMSLSFNVQEEAAACSEAVIAPRLRRSWSRGIENDAAVGLTAEVRTPVGQHAHRARLATTAAHRSGCISSAELRTASAVHHAAARAKHGAFVRESWADASNGHPPSFAAASLASSPRFASAAAVGGETSPPPADMRFINARDKAPSTGHRSSAPRCAARTSTSTWCGLGCLARHLGDSSGTARPPRRDGLGGGPRDRSGGSVQCLRKTIEEVPLGRMSAPHDQRGDHAEAQDLVEPHQTLRDPVGQRGGRQSDASRYRHLQWRASPTVISLAASVDRRIPDRGESDLAPLVAKHDFKSMYRRVPLALGLTVVCNPVEDTMQSHKLYGQSFGESHAELLQGRRPRQRARHPPPV